MQNVGRGIWRKFSGLPRERRDGCHPSRDTQAPGRDINPNTKLEYFPLDRNIRSEIRKLYSFES
jgi:hypothetical protein